MGIGQSIRRAGLKARAIGSRIAGSLGGGQKSERSWRLPKIWSGRKGGALEGGALTKISLKAGAGAGALLVLYYIGGALLMEAVDDDTAFTPRAALQPGQSAAVAMVIGLIDREVNTHGWSANDPFFKPTAILDNMPNYQQGIIAALARFGFELTDQLGRTRGSSQADADLQEASGLLQYVGDRWIWDPSVSLLPTATSEQQYRKAASALGTYNDRLAAGTAVFERRSDNLLATLDRIALDLGSSSAVIDTHVSEQAGFLFHRNADDIYYNIKGQMYGYYMILAALGQDFDEIIAARDLVKPWDQMLRSFELAASQSPGIIINGKPDAQSLPCHLCGQGFYLLRARTQLREITNILLK